MKSSVKAGGSVLVHEEFMNYQDVIEHIKRSLAIVDIVKDGQVGMTLRVLEAVFFGKKVISNNVKLRETDIYATGNVYILGNETIPLSLFLEQQTKEYPKRLLKKYSYETWLNNIISI